MAFTGNYTCNVFKTGLMNGTFNFTSGTFKIALYTNAASLDATTAAYTATGESSGGNYVAGGQNLTITQVTTCLLYTSPSPRDGLLSRMPSSA